MSVSNDNNYNKESLQTINDVEKALTKLQADIPQEKLDMLKNFNKTYLIITRNVLGAVRQGKFKDTEFLHDFDTIFASYYIDALKNYVSDNKLVVPPAWSIAFKAAERGKVSPFKIMVLGVNAHINNDIPQVLLESGAGKQHIKDYYFVNRLIKRSISQVINELDKSNRLISPKAKALKPIYKVVMFGLVVLFRRLAWRNYHLLKRNKIQRYLVELRSKRVARLVMLLPI
ncbi:hypothetical protein BH09PAT3_BH09PAT3_1730 [soil metagenome]